MRALITDAKVSACHDISDGGLYVAVAEMALAGDIGAEIAPPDSADPAPWLFGEDQARYVLTTAAPDAVTAAADEAGVAASAIGHTGGAALTVTGADTRSLTELREAHEGWLPGYMAGR